MFHHISSPNSLKWGIYCIKLCHSLITYCKFVNCSEVFIQEHSGFVKLLHLFASQQSSDKDTRVNYHKYYTLWHIILRFMLRKTCLLLDSFAKTTPRVFLRKWNLNTKITVSAILLCAYVKLVCQQRKGHLEGICVFTDQPYLLFATHKIDFVTLKKIQGN